MNPPFLSAPVSRRRFLQQLSLAGAVDLVAGRARGENVSPTPKRLGIALCGLGNYATNLLLPAIKKSRFWKVAGVVTGSRAKGEQWARDLGFPNKNIFSYETMDSMAGCPEIDVVYVVTPNALHARHTISAANAGKHVICEKPMAVTVAECDAMIEACRSRGVRLMVGYRLHYESHHLELARLAREQTFGPFMSMSGENGFDVGDVPDKNNWRLMPKLSGGGPIMDMGVYVIQAVCMAKVEAAPVSVTARFGPVTRPKVFTDVDQSIEWTMDYADGATAKCLATYADTVSKFRAEATRGWAEIEFPAFYYDDPVLVTSRGKPDLPSVNHQLAQMDAMAGEILENRPSRAPGEMGKRDLAVIEAVYAAARSGKRVEVRT